MIRRLLLMPVAGLVPAVAAAAPTATLHVRHREFLETNCFACHGPDTQEAGVRLDDLPLAIGTIVDVELRSGS